MKTNYSLLKKIFVPGYVLVLFILSALHFDTHAQTYTFTSAGATASLGPTQLQVNSAYALTNLNGSVTVSGIGVQNFTVPTSGMYRVTAIGSQGGGADGGKGAIIAGDFNFTAGDVLRIVVGQQGITLAAEPNSCGGGGGSYVLTGVGTSTTTNVLVIAGGGGGSPATYSILRHASITTTANNGMGASNTDGAGGINGNGGNKGISANTQDRAAGGGGFFTDGQSTAQPGFIGAANGGSCFINGSCGGTHNTTGVPGGFGGGGAVWTTGHKGGGGGGGYSGGGGGQTNGSNSNTHSGGGGGSLNNGSNQANSISTGTGDGVVYVTRLCNFIVGTNTGNNLLCNGSSITLTTNAVSSYTWDNGSNAAFLTVSPAVTTSYTLTAMSPLSCMTSVVITITVSGSAPVLTVTASSPSVCLGNTATLTASGALSYTWTGGISNGLSFAPATTQTYVVSGQNGCGTTTAAVTITVGALPIFAIGVPSVVCAGQTTSLSAGGANTYSWLPLNISGSNVMAAPQSNTTYTVIGTTGACNGVFTLNIAVNPNPTISVSTTASLTCAGESVTLTATGGLSYTWQPGGSGGSSFVANPSAPISYQVTGNNSFGCTSSASQPIIAFPTPTVIVSANSTSICLGASVNLYASGADTYLWSNSGTNNTTIETPIITTTYSVTGTSTLSGCSDIEIITVNVYVAEIGITAPLSACLGTTVNLNASGANNYVWTTGDLVPSIFVAPLVSTNYTVNGVVTIGSATCAGAGTTALTVLPLPVVLATCSRTNICKGEKTLITASGANTYVWSNTAITPTILVNPLTHTPYMVTGTSTNNCVKTASIQINVSNCTGIAEANENVNENISVFPNPNNGEFTISGKTAMDLKIVNELGQTVNEFQLDAGNNYSAQVKDLAIGIYFLNASNASVKLNRKIIVQ